MSRNHPNRKTPERVSAQHHLIRESVKGFGRISRCRVRSPLGVNEVASGESSAPSVLEGAFGLSAIITAALGSSRLPQKGLSISNRSLVRPPGPNWYSQSKSRVPPIKNPQKPTGRAASPSSPNKPV